MKNSNQELNPSYGLDPKDAIDMLVADHKGVARLFADFKRLTDENRDDEKAALVAKICQELTLHTKLEEDLFYPAVREAIDDEDQVDEAIVEHAGAKELIAQLESADPEDDFYDAKVTVLGEQIDHHVEEEEGRMFPKARQSGLDTLELGAVMFSRKAELQNGKTGKTATRSSAVLGAAHDAEAGDEEEHDPPRTTKARAKKHASKKTNAKKKTR
jgi:hemerythrin superfamily protein